MSVGRVKSCSATWAEYQLFLSHGSSAISMSIDAFEFYNKIQMTISNTAKYFRAVVYDLINFKKSMSVATATSFTLTGNYI